MKYLKYIIVLVLFGCNNQNKSEQVEQVITETDQILKEVSLEVYDFNGVEPYLNKKDDTVYVVNFWATWCAPCVKELPYFEKINKTYKDKNVEVILVSLDFPNQYESKLKPFIQKEKLHSKILVLNDPDSNAWIPKVSENWSGAIPATLIYNKDKRQFYEKSFNYNELETELKQFLNQ